MARIARVIAPGIPHHVTQRGNRRQKTFFLDDDYRLYLNLMMDESYFIAAARYVELNPVRARIVSKPEEYQWSSVSAHLTGKDDLIVKVAPLLEMADNWKDILHSGAEDQRFQEIRRHECTGRPLGSESFVESIENALGRCLRRGKPGPKAKSKQN